jgi:hypothetical protein
MTSCDKCDNKGVNVYRTKFDGNGMRGIVPCDCVPVNRKLTVGSIAFARQTRNLRYGVNKLDASITVLAVN